MTPTDFAQLECFFDAYTRRFAGPDGRFHPMQQLKVEHSWRVVANAERILAAEKWQEAQVLLGKACALLHDVGRFPQYAEYRSFEDSKSFNHATRSVAVLRDEGVLDALRAEERERILVSVGCHNLRELSPTLLPEHAACAHLVRDADKLDIFRILEETVRKGHLDDHPEIAWSLPAHERVNPDILAAIRAGQGVHYELVRSMCDFVLIQVGWLHSGLHYPATVAIAWANKALEFREQYVLAIDDSPTVRDCFADTRTAMRKRLPS